MGIKVDLYVAGSYNHEITITRFFGIYKTVYIAMFCEDVGSFKFVNARNGVIVEKTNSRYLYDYLLKQLLTVEPKLIQLSFNRVLKQRGLQL